MIAAFPAPRFVAVNDDVHLKFVPLGISFDNALMFAG